MVVVYMSLMSPKGIGRKGCLQTKGPFGLSNNPKGIQTFEGRNSSKKQGNL
jgi:hypothetical protein